MLRKLVTIIALCLTTQAFATDMEIRGVEMKAYGVFVPKRTEHRELARSNAPPSDEVDGYHFTRFTNEIPAALGKDFGVQYVVNTAPKGGEFRVTHVIKFPEGGLVQPNGRVYTEERENLKIRIGMPTLHGYGFDESWEMVPGEWVFEVWHDNARLLHKSFTILPPEDTGDAKDGAE